jgi:hypothetical protein
MVSINSLITNKWEFYDVAKMRRLKMTIIIPVAVILWFLLFMLVSLFFSMAGYNDLTVKLMVSTIVFLAMLAMITMKINQMDREKKDWYFAGVNDARLNREQILDFMKGFLARRKYVFVEASTHRSLTLWITYFDIQSADFKVRLWFSVINGVPIVEMGFGPETMINKKLLEQLRTEMSAEFASKFGFASAPDAAPAPVA